MTKLTPEELADLHAYAGSLADKWVRKIPAHIAALDTEIAEKDATIATQAAERDAARSEIAMLLAGADADAFVLSQVGRERDTATAEMASRDATIAAQAATLQAMAILLCDADDAMRAESDFACAIEHGANTKEFMDIILAWRNRRDAVLAQIPAPVATQDGGPGNG